MVGLGFGLVGVGYWLLAYGFSQIRGCNAGFFQLAWPGSFQGCNPDSPSANSGTGSDTGSGTQDNGAYQTGGAAAGPVNPKTGMAGAAGPASMNFNIRDLQVTH